MALLTHHSNIFVLAFTPMRALRRHYSSPNYLGFVSLHRPLVTNLVISGLLVPLFALLFREGLELRRDQSGNVTKRGFGVLFLDGWASRNREQEKGTHVTLGSVGVLLCLLACRVLGVTIELLELLEPRYDRTSN